MALPITTNNATIWGRYFYFETLDTTSPVFRLQTLEEAGYPLGNSDPGLPEELQGKFDAGFFFEFFTITTIVNNVPVEKSVFNEDIYGDKVPVLISYFTTEGNDGIRARLDPSAPGGYALYLSTLRLGGGDDYFQVVDENYKIPYAAFANVDFAVDIALPYVMQSNIFAGDGDDYVSPLLPRESVFKGGSNTDYSSTVLSDDLTLEELSEGDTFELLGSRYDWDIEFKDGNGDGLVTLASILDERDYLVLANNNRVSGFERLKFSNLYFDLVLYDQLDSNAIYGQPEYFLEGVDADGAPLLNSTIARGSELWEAFRFNRTIMEGIAGTATAKVDVYTGDDGDTPNLTGALQFANLYTESGADIAVIGSADQASFDLGDDGDSMVVKGLFSKSSGFGGAGRDNIIIDKLANSIIDAGADDDVVEIRSSSANGSFVGGAGASDRMVFSASESSFGFRYSTDPVTGLVTLADSAANTYVGFENFTFADKSYTLPALLAAIDSNFVSPTDEAPLTPDGGLVISVGPNAGNVGLTGTSKADVLIGSNQSNKFYGGLGADIMTGLLGPDTFRFRLSDGLNQGDQIVDFDPLSEDRIEIADVSRQSRLGKLFKGQAEIPSRKAAKKAFAVVNSASAAAVSKRQLVYDRTSGALYYNENGKARGFGNGGQVATFQNLFTDLQATDIFILYTDQQF